MWKNLAIGVPWVLLLVLVALIYFGKLTWQQPQEELGVDPTSTLERAIKMHYPQVLEFGDASLLCVPQTRMRGNNWQVDNKFYVYEEGTLKEVPYAK